MKDATGELSMTAVAVVAIAAIGVVFTTLVWPQIRQNILRSTYCSQSFNCGNCQDGMCDCQFCDTEGGTDLQTTAQTCDTPQSIKCPDNGSNTR